MAFVTIGALRVKVHRKCIGSFSMGSVEVFFYV